MTIDRNRTGGRRRRGVTLVEAVLFVAVALGLIVGGLIFYAQALSAGRIETATRVLSALVQEARVLHRSHGFDTPLPLSAAAFDPAGDLTGVLVASGAIPISQVGPAGVQHPWGGPVRVHGVRLDGTLPAVAIEARDLPPFACTRLLAANASDADAARDTRGLSGGWQNPVGHGLIFVAVWDAASASGMGLWPRVYSPSQAGMACRVGSAAFGGAVASGGVSAPDLAGAPSVVMGFTVN